MKMRAIPNADGYFATDDGRIWSDKTHRFLKQAVGHHGYPYVVLSIEGKTKTELVHRLVARTFIPNTDCKTYVNHIDEDKTNNNLSNLEWVTPSENANHGTAIDRRRATYGIDRMRQSAAIARMSNPKKRTMNIDTGEVYESSLAASLATGISQGNISAACRGDYKTAGGFRWKYLKESK